MQTPDRRDNTPSPLRKPFSALARQAITGKFRETRSPSARWVEATNLAWVSWKREDDRHVYVSLRRVSSLITGEIGFSNEPVDLDTLPQVTNAQECPVEGCRIPLGFLLHGHSKTWSAGGSEKALIERLEWIAQQLSMRLHAFMTSTTPKA